MGDHNYYTALSHAVLAGTSIYCLMQHSTEMGMICYGFIGANSILGLWRWGNPEAGSTSKSMYDLSSTLQEMFALGAIAAEMWIASNIVPELGFVQVVTPIIPLSLYLLDKDHKNITTSIMVANGMSIAYVSIITSKWWGLAAAASYLWGYLYVKDQGSIRDIPAVDLINYELCFFCYFALKALSSI